jgi:hypothetical protein
MTRLARLSGLAALFVWAALVGCDQERYPLKILHGRTYLEGRDKTGQIVRFSVDTGSDRSFLSRSWVQSVGGRVVPGPPGSWGGIRLFAQWRESAREVPVPDGVPRFLEDLPVARGGPFSPLAGPVSTVGLLGTDLLWNWSLDFRGEVPFLVRSRVDPAVRQLLFQDDGRFALAVSEGGAGENLLPSRAVVDTGSPFPLVLFQSDPPAGLFSLENSRSPVTANGTVTRFFGLGNFRVGRALLPSVALSGEFSGARILLLGTPALQALRAVVDFKDWNIVLAPRARDLPVTVDSPEAWAWSATVLPGRGIRVDAVIPGSTLDRRGLRAGDLVTRIGSEAADQPRSSLEWRRAWISFALEGLVSR